LLENIQAISFSLTVVESLYLLTLFVMLKLVLELMQCWQTQVTVAAVAETNTGLSRFVCFTKSCLRISKSNMVSMRDQERLRFEPFL